MQSKRLAIVVLVVVAVGLLIGCGQNGTNQPTQPSAVQTPDSDERRVTGTPEAAGTGLKYTLVPNEDLTDWSYVCKWHMSPWQMGPNYTAIDEVTDWRGNTALDSLSISPWGSCDYMPDSWGFTNVNNPHPAAVIASIDVNLWIHPPFLGQWDMLMMEATLFLNGSEVSSEYVWVYDPVMTKVTASFVNLGALSKVNSMVVELRGVSVTSDFWVHAMNANVFAYVPGKQPPIPHQTP